LSTIADWSSNVKGPERLFAYTAAPISTITAAQSHVVRSNDRTSVAEADRAG
jgi:hypothetical protein